MKVYEIMTPEVGFCFWQDDLSKVVETMRQKDCGIVPIVNREMQVIAMVSDRDVCLALHERAEKISEITAKELIRGKVVACEKNDKIKDVLKKMRKNQLKRLPVISQDGKLAGIISIADILLCTKLTKTDNKDVLKTVKAISQPRPILLHEIG